MPAASISTSFPQPALNLSLNLSDVEYDCEAPVYWAPDSKSCQLAVLTVSETFPKPEYLLTHRQPQPGEIIKKMYCPKLFRASGCDLVVDYIKKPEFEFVGSPINIEELLTVGRRLARGCGMPKGGGGRAVMKKFWSQIEYDIVLSIEATEEPDLPVVDRLVDVHVQANQTS